MIKVGYPLSFTKDKLREVLRDSDYMELSES